MADEVGATNGSDILADDKLLGKHDKQPACQSQFDLEKI